MGKPFMGMLCMLPVILLITLHVHAADATLAIATTDGRAFASLTAVEIETLSVPDQAAYQTWAATHNAETSTYQQTEGPNTMDLSSDFSM
ncbi:MAG: hypothetical protein ACTS9Y_05145 [Methylophilus sp.]|uniref:hypothetical protein n=1 Tax=Methylophilus sp. TaxID=29541 RepID=UPI003F9F2DA8